jgi:hypothetical protein
VLQAELTKQKNKHGAKYGRPRRLQTLHSSLDLPFQKKKHLPFLWHLGWTKCTLFAFVYLTILTIWKFSLLATKSVFNEIILHVT